MYYSVFRLIKCHSCHGYLPSRQWANLWPTKSASKSNGSAFANLYITIYCCTSVQCAKGPQGIIVAQNSLSDASPTICMLEWDHFPIYIFVARSKLMHNIHCPLLAVFDYDGMHARMILSLGSNYSKENNHVKR